MATFIKLDSKRKMHTFEILGYDFMIDNDFNVKLIEVNTNPSLDICCPLLSRIVPAVLDNAFRLSIDPLFPPPDFNLAKKNVMHEIMPINKFHLVFDENVNGSVLRDLAKNWQQMNLRIQDDEGQMEEQDDEESCEELEVDEDSKTLSYDDQRSHMHHN